LLEPPKSISKVGMTSVGERYDFASDNTAAICPEAWAALQEANAGEASSYGEDRWTARVTERVREIFETNSAVFFVFNGTAANALAVAQLCQPFHSVLCHEHSHIQTDECGAPEFFTNGSKLLVAGGANGKIDLAEAELILSKQRELHSHKPRLLSLTQSTELGTVYDPGEIEELTKFARQRGMLVHMDGARFANAVATLRCRPSAVTWKAGVDVLCFGGTKNGLGGAELVVFFNSELAHEFDYRVKQGGHLASKMRFLAAPWSALLHDDLWLRNAGRANQAATRLADRLRTECRIDAVFPVQANAVFVRLEEDLVRDLHGRGWHFYKFLEPDIYRLMCSWAARDEAIDKFLGDLIALRRG
jgi:threonine aldolase